jgi:pimeloyl-ACP methyl ester carboxylesterase
VAPAIRCRKRRWGAAHLVDYAQHRSIRNGQRDPVMAVRGTIRNSGPQLEEMMREVANEVTGFRVPATAHWIAEENPAEFTAGLLKFLKTAEGS